MPEPKEYAVESVLHCVDGPLNIREGPSIDYDVVARFWWYDRTVPNGPAIEHSESNYWYEVTKDGVPGWAAGWFLTPGECVWTLDPDGIGPARIGELAEPAIEIMTARLGEADLWVWPEGCDQETLEWRRYGIRITMDLRTGLASGYSYLIASNDDVPEVDMGLVTPEGISPGATGDEILAAYPNAEWLPGGAWSHYRVERPGGTYKFWKWEGSSLSVVSPDYREHQSCSGSG